LRRRAGRPAQLTGGAGGGQQRERERDGERGNYGEEKKRKEKKKRERGRMGVLAPWPAALAGGALADGVVAHGHHWPRARVKPRPGPVHREWKRL